MKYRVVKAVGERAEGVWLGTFHSFCLEKILRSVNPDIQPLDDIDHRILLRRNIADLGLVHFWRLAEPAEFLRDFVTFFSRCQDELVTPDDYQRYVDGLRRKHEARKSSLEPDACQIAEEEIARQEEFARVYRVSERLLRERNLHTFGAQLLQAVEVSAQRSSAARSAARAISLHSGGRISGHQHRAARIAVAACRRPPQHHGRRRPQSGHLPVPRRLLRKLHDVSEALLRRCRTSATAREKTATSFRSRRIIARPSAF